MVAMTDQKARAFDLFTSVMELTRDGSRNIGDVCSVLQAIKDDPSFATRLLAKNGAASVWPVWWTLLIGAKTQKELREELKKGGFRIGNWANDIMQKGEFVPLAEVCEVKLVRIKIRDLGFKKEPTTTELFARAKERGLELCPAEVGPHLRLAYKDQPNGDWFWIAMEPITDSLGDPGVFSLGHASGGVWLDADCVKPENRWNLENEIVFVSRK